LRLSGEVDFHELAKATPGYVGADLTSLTGAAGVIAVKRIFQEIGDGRLILPTEDDIREGVEDMAVDAPEGALPTEDAQEVEAVVEVVPAPEPTKTIGDPSIPFSTLHPALLNTPIAQFLLSHPNPLTARQLSPLTLIPADFMDALKIVQPSAKREGFATVPDISWADIGALKTIRDELHMAIVQPIRRPELFHTVGIDAPSGVLLWGPPGCGKTLLAKAVANESRANFISVKGPELLNKVGVITLWGLT
jgi:ribosome biogenesis ATPase